MPYLIVGEKRDGALRADADPGDATVVGSQGHRSPGLNLQCAVQEAADQVAVTDEKLVPVLTPSGTEEAGEGRLNVRSGLRLGGRVGRQIPAIAALPGFVETRGKAFAESARPVQGQVGKICGDDRRRLCGSTIRTGVQGSEMHTDPSKPFGGQFRLPPATRNESFADPRVAEITVVVFAMPDKIESSYCHRSLPESAAATVAKLGAERNAPGYSQ